MRYRAEPESLAESRAKAIERAKEEYDRKIEFLWQYFGRFRDRPEAERLAWYQAHAPIGDFLLQMAALGPWQAREAKWRMTDAARLLEQSYA